MIQRLYLVVLLAMAAGNVCAESANDRIRAYFDALEAEVSAAIVGASIAREPASIKITYPAEMAFPSEVHEIPDNAKEALNVTAEILNKYKSVFIAIEGQADHRGDADFNHALSDQRANSVYQLLKAVGVAEGRMTTVPFGERHANGKTASKLERRIALVVSVPYSVNE